MSESILARLPITSRSETHSTRHERLTRLSLLVLAVALAGLGCSDEPAPAADPSSLRNLRDGSIVGSAAPDHAAHIWKGLRFAQPPVGALRWRAPLPPAPWEGTQEALERGAECVQFSMDMDGAFAGDEDCLFLDVYAPRFPADAIPEGANRRPVMVWIHGGGNSVGSSEVYDASRLAAENDVIVVAIQYRLGVLGWFSHPALRASGGSPEDQSGNFGTLDTIRALEWVRDNAAAFGGDPGNVTVFGESAGGTDVFALLISPRAKGLFHRAISQSGGLSAASRAQAENLIDAPEPGRSGSSNEFLLGHLVKDGRASDREAAKPVLAAMSKAEIEAYLRGKSGHELIDVFDGQAMGGMYFVPEIIRDGHVISDADPLALLADPARHNAVPTIVGTNREETKLFALMDSPYLRHMFGTPIGIRDEAAFDLAGEYGGWSWKSQGVDRPAEAMVSGGRDDVYGYRFDWDEEGSLLWVDLGTLLGASHAIEILFVFGFTDLGSWTDNMYADIETAEELSAQMRSYWTNFARTGNPGRGTDGALPPWERWQAGAGSSKYIVLDSAAGGGLRMDSEIYDTQSLVERLESDDRFANAEQRCRAFRDIVSFSTIYTPEYYESFADGACTALPLPVRSPLGI